MKKLVYGTSIVFIALVVSFTVPFETLAHGSHTDGIDYHSHLPLTDSYEGHDGELGGCIYGEYIAVDVPDGVECQPHIAILH